MSSRQQKKGEKSVDYYFEQLQQKYRSEKDLEIDKRKTEKCLKELKENKEKQEKTLQKINSDLNETSKKLCGNNCLGCRKPWEELDVHQGVTILTTCYHVLCPGCADRCFGMGKCPEQSCNIPVDRTKQEKWDISSFSKKRTEKPLSVKDKLKMRMNPNWSNLNEFGEAEIATLYMFNQERCDLDISRAKLRRKQFALSNHNISFEYIIDETNKKQYFGTGLIPSEQIETRRKDAIDIMESFAKISLLAKEFDATYLEVSVPIVAVLYGAKKHSVFLLERYDDKLKEFDKHKVRSQDFKKLSDFQEKIARNSPYRVSEMEALIFQDKIVIYNFSLINKRNGSQITEKIARYTK